MVKSFFLFFCFQHDDYLLFSLSRKSILDFSSIARQRRKRIKLRTITTANFPSIRLMQNLWREFSSNCFLQFYNYCRFNSLLAFVAPTFKQLDEERSKKVEKIRLHLFQQLSPSLESFFRCADKSENPFDSETFSEQQSFFFVSLAVLTKQLSQHVVISSTACLPTTFST